MLEGAKVLKNQLWSRRPPVEKKELKEKVLEIIEHNFGDELKNLSREERKMAIPQVGSKLQLNLITAIVNQHKYGFKYCTRTTEVVMKEAIFLNILKI